MTAPVLEPAKASQVGSCTRCKGSLHRIHRLGAVWVACERCGLRRSRGPTGAWPGRALCLGLVWVAR